MSVFDQISDYGIVPLVTLDNVEDAKPLAEALVKGGIPVAEVTFRTDKAALCMREMSKHVPELLLGSGTVHTVDQVKETVDNGGKFVITPGFNREVVEYCVKNNIEVCPGTVVPSDIEEALQYGIKTVKFFPAEAYGGVKVLKALGAPFADIKFVPTGGVGLDNLRDYLDLDNVAAVGGSFVPPPHLVKEKKWDEIACVCQDIMRKVFDFRVGHVGINAETKENAKNITDEFVRLFDVSVKKGNFGYFAGNLVEVLEVPFVGEKGHICISTKDLKRAIAMLKRKNVEFDADHTYYDAKGKLLTTYFKDQVGGFALHIVQAQK